MIKLFSFRLFLVYFFAMTSFVTAFGQNDTLPKPPQKPASFPQDWLGKWSGQLDIYNSKGFAQSVEMELEIAPIDSSDRFVWAITYGPDKVAGRRPYELEIVDPIKGWYAIDEKNTIKLEAYLFQNKLYSRFEVMGNWLLCSYEKNKDHIRFEIISGSNEAVSTTGGQKLEEEDIPEVKAYPIVVNQKALLYRKSEQKK